MVANSPSDQNGGTDHILRPRPIKPGNPMILRAQSEEGGLKPNGNHDGQLSGMSSGRSTPLPPDAPPSAQSISSARKQVRAQQKHRMFPTVEYAARVSHFDPKSEYRDFRGFFVLFWIGLAIMVLTSMLRNIKDTGYPLRHQVWDLLTTKTWELGLSDGLMVASTALSVPLQMLFRRGSGAFAWLRWEKLGMPIHSIFQAAWLVLWVNWPFIFNWTWTAQVFFTLHTLTLLMKMHSYAFYNGHLSTTEHRLSALDNPENASTAAAVRYPSSSAQLNDMDKAVADRKNHEKESLTQLREDLALELTSPLGQVTYPQNLSLLNYADYILCPTLCYELEYPRTPKIQWVELFWKTLAVFGCIFLLTITSEEFIVPVLNESAIRLQGVEGWSEQGLILAETISLLLFPFMVTFLLVFLVIFEYLLGAFAEISCFADRHFYSDWWNSCDWLEFSREWNIPVHHFLRRHVYGASRPYVSRNTATLITFLVSAFGHELVMGCITKKLRGYGFVAQMTQLPIVALQRTKIVRSRKLFNNALFWISMILGLAMIPRKFRRKDLRDVPSSKKESHHSNPLVSTNHTIQQQSYLKVASSLVSEGLTLATSQLQALYTSLPPSLQAYIDLAFQTIHRNLPHQLQRYSRTLPDKTSSIPVNLDPTTIATAWILPLIALLFFMTRNYWHGGHSGGYSPATQYSGGTPRVTEGDYEYLDEGDYNPQNRYRNDRSDSYGFPRSRNASKAEPELDPDILIMKHKGTTYPLHFPAYDISEGRLSVGDLRKVAAKETGTRDPRCIKLLYKGKSLHNDHRACKEENLKQNSEILCVISSEPDRGGDDGNDSSSSASSDMIANGIDDMGRGARIDVDGTIINDREPKKRRNHRGGRQKKRRDPSPSRASPTSSSTSTFLQPPNATSTNGSSHSHTTSRQPSPPRPTQPPQQKKPTTPSEALDQISTNFHQTFIPQCQRFISHPPLDPKTREFEYKKLSEAILAQVILKLDEVETQGDEGVRARRKELVRETQGWLGSLDERGRR